MNSSKEPQRISPPYLSVIDNSFVQKMQNLKDKIKRDEEDAVYFSFLMINNINPIVTVYQQLTQYCQDIEKLFVTNPRKANKQLNDLLITYQKFIDLKMDLFSFYEDYKVLPEALALEFHCDRKEQAVTAFHHRCHHVLHKVDGLNDTLLTAPQKITSGLIGVISGAVGFIVGAVVGALIGIIALTYNSPLLPNESLAAVAGGVGAIVGGCIGAVVGFQTMNRYMKEKVFEKKLGFFDNFNKEVKHFVDHHPAKLKR